MKKLISICLFSLATFAVFGAAKKINPNVVENSDGTVNITGIDKDSSVKVNQKYEGEKNITIVDSKKVTKNNPVAFDLSDFGNKEIYIEFSCKMKIEEPAQENLDLSWMINDFEAGMPVLIHEVIDSNQWVTMKAEKVVAIGEKKSFYLSGSGLPSEYKIYIKDLSLKLSGEGITSKPVPTVSWTDAPSIKDAVGKYFDHVGIACTYRNELQKPDIQKGLSHHVNSITMGNEFKPDALFGFNRISKFEDFVAEDGNTYQMPTGFPNFTTMNIILTIAKRMGVQIRGHVLVWHSQTPTYFFREGFSTTSELVDQATMTARQEWYIKSVIEHVNQWEQENNNGEHIVYAWDVVNEAVADGATVNSWLRTDSNWYKIYKDESFIINAFRFANKYAPADVQLVYNDYGCYSAGKRYAICNLIDEIKAVPDARIDAVGMQSHVKLANPPINLSDGNNSFEEAVQEFIKHGVNVQITELDIANAKGRYSPMVLKEKYKQYYQMFIRNRATEDKPGITSVTVWGITDATTWLDNQAEYKGTKQYPLLFNGDFTCKPAFFGVIESAKE